MTVLNIVVEDVSRNPAEVEDAAAWRDQFDLPWEVLADTDETWVTVWGDATSRSFAQHSYTVLDRQGRVVWQDFGEDDDVVPSIAAAVEALE